MKTSFLAILAIILTACGPTKKPEQTVNPLPQPEDGIRALSAKYPAKAVNLLLRRMQAELPKGWSASYDKEYSALDVSRDEAVLAETTVINGPPDAKPERTKYAFSFRVMPAVSPDEYHRFAAENARIQEEANRLYDELVKKGLQRKFDSFGWKTEEDKVAVARYDALKMSRHSLPDYHFQDISLQWLFGRDDSLFGPWIYVSDERIRVECTQTQKKILKLLSPYEGT